MQAIKYHAGKTTTKARCKCFLFIASALFLIAGCAAQGAKRVPRDRFDYNAAIAQSTREQMLMNIETDYRADQSQPVSNYGTGNPIVVLFRLQAPTPAGAAPILSLPTG